VLEALSRRIISEKLHIAWITHVRFDRDLTLERCRMMREAGCRQLTLGLEAYNDRLLRLMRKGVTTELVDSVLSTLSRAGIPASVYMILGLPTETEQEALQSYASVEQLRSEGLIARCNYSLFHIQPYSRIARRPREFGISRIHFPSGQDLEPPAYRFEGSGMARESVIDLGVRLGLFDWALTEVLVPKDTDLERLDELNFNGLRGPLNYGAGKMASIIRRFWRRTGWDGSLSFGAWLERGNASIEVMHTTASDVSTPLPKTGEGPVR
jgi:hypothetical protein